MNIIEKRYEKVEKLVKMYAIRESTQVEISNRNGVPLRIVRSVLQHSNYHRTILSTPDNGRGPVKPIFFLDSPEYAALDKYDF